MQLDGFQLATLRQIRAAGGMELVQSIVFQNTLTTLADLGLVQVVRTNRANWTPATVRLLPAASEVC